MKSTCVDTSEEMRRRAVLDWRGAGDCIRAVRSVVGRVLPPQARHIAMNLGLKHPTVSHEPHFDWHGKELFERHICTATVYLEYGSGGSTFWAHNKVRVLVTVDSDRTFLGAIKRKLERTESPRAEARFIYANIGFVKEWGEPIFVRPTPRRVAKWKQYVVAPWTDLQARGLKPDLILVDGRFRVACVLQSLLKLRGQTNCRILVDDYPERAHYHAMEEFATVCEIHGRMALVKAKPWFCVESCEKKLAEFQKDWR